MARAANIFNFSKFYSELNMMNVKLCSNCPVTVACMHVLSLWAKECR